MHSKWVLFAVITLAVSMWHATNLPARLPFRGLTAPEQATEGVASRGRSWVILSTASANVHVLRGSRAEPLGPTLSIAVDRAIDADLKFLGAAFVGPKLQLFIVGSDADMTAILGGAAFGRARPELGTAYMVGNDSMPPALRHEIMHLLLWRAWGPRRTSWLSEGIAVRAAGGCAGYTPSAIAAELSREGKLVPLERLWHHFDLAWEAGAINYVEAASLVDYIDRVFGRTRLRAVWEAGDGQSPGSVLGINDAALERNWRADLGKQVPSVRWSKLFPKLVSHGCE